MSRVLIACEFSGIVRRAFAALGHDAWSCDLLPAEDRSKKHITGDAREILNDGWDLLIVQVDTPLYHKSRRQRQMNIGAKASQFPLPGGRNDRLKKKIGGRVVERWGTQ